MVNSMFKWSFLLSALLFAMPRQAWSQTLGEYWGTAEQESKYYKIVDIPIPCLLYTSDAADE